MIILILNFESAFSTKLSKLLDRYLLNAKN